MTRIIMRYSTPDLDVDVGGRRVAAAVQGALSAHLDDTSEWIEADVAGARLPPFRHIPMGRIFAHARAGGAFYSQVAPIADEIRDDHMVIDTWKGPWTQQVEITDPDNPPEPVQLGTLVEVSARVRLASHHISRVIGLISGRWTGPLVTAPEPLSWPHEPPVTLTRYRSMTVDLPSDAEGADVHLWSE